MTKQQAAILRVIQASPFHMTADEIYLAAKAEMPKLGIATVYRNLSSLCGAGIIRKIEIPGGPDRYDRNTKPHDHMVCTRCGEMLDCSVELEDFLNRIEAGGAKVTGYHLQVSCICSRCLAKEDASA